MASGPQAGLALVDALTSVPALEQYHLLPSVRGDLLVKVGPPRRGAHRVRARGVADPQRARARRCCCERAPAPRPRREPDPARAAARSATDRAELTGAQARHAIDVLRVTPGQEIRVGVIDGPRGTGRVTRVGRRPRRARSARSTPRPPPVPDVDLLLALPRPKVMRRLWAQLAALGRRPHHPDQRRACRAQLLRHPRARPGGLPAAARSRGCSRPRTRTCPRVSIHRRFRPLVEDELDALCPHGARLVAHPAGGAAPVGAWPPAPARVLLAVGPGRRLGRFRAAAAGRRAASRR